MRHKQKADGSAPGVQLGLIVTPMLDMAFQILSFFIATYHPSAMEGHIPGSLVPPENPAMKSKDPNPIPQIENPLSIKEDDLLPELQEAITIRAKSIVRGQEIGSRTEGTLGQIFIKNSLETEPQMVADTHVPIAEAMGLLESTLKKMIEKGSNKANLKLAADGDLRQEYVMMVYSTAKKAGYDNIHFVPPPVLNTKLR